MRHQLSITVDEEVLSQLREYMRSNKYAQQQVPQQEPYVRVHYEENDRG